MRADRSRFLYATRAISRDIWGKQYIDVETTVPAANREVAERKLLT